MAQEKSKRNKKIYKKNLEGKTAFDLALEFGIKPETIYKIISREKMRAKIAKLEESSV